MLATLHGIGSRNRVQAAMPQMGASVVKRTVLTVLTVNDKYAPREVFPFEPYCASGSVQLRGCIQINGQLPICIASAVIYSGLGGCRDTQ